jgi:uncharacterized protein YgiM (DUF1202 family)
VTPDAVQVSAGLTASMTFCTVTPSYNLNLREKPNTDSTIYMSIPYGTAVLADARTSDNWYHVSYDNQIG